MENNAMHFYGRTVVFWTGGTLSETTGQLIESSFFELVIDKLLFFLRQHDSPLLGILPDDLSEEQQQVHIISVLKKLATTSKEKILEKHLEFKHTLSNTHLLHQFVEELYNFWRNYERYLVCMSVNGSDYEKKPYRTFNETVNHINDLIRKAYRDICENITGDHPRVYRQVSAGFQVGLIATKKEWNCPEQYFNLKEIPFITQTLLYPPLIIDPSMNKRTGQFVRVDSNPLKGVGFREGEWLCYPAKVGELVIYVYFCNKFIGLGCSLANLFELADEKDLERKPDAVYAFGVPSSNFGAFKDSQTIFYDDEESNMLVAAVPCSDEFGYFGYLKKMILTLHNIIMMKKGRLPLHGAMVNVTLKNHTSANIIILGDTGAGKSESLEAFRILGDQYLRSMTIIFDDMGSLEITDNGKIKAYGTEIGAFVRLDDLQPGFAFGNLDRSIIMSPQKINARAVIPVTTLKDILEGHKVDYFFYANNYEEVDESHPIIEQFNSKDEALDVFREGAVMSKGTTTSTGLVHTYFANIFGPPQYKEMHEKLAEKYFKDLFSSKVFVGQLRTRLGIQGYESKGPEAAAEELFKLILSKGKK